MDQTALLAVNSVRVMEFIKTILPTPAITLVLQTQAVQALLLPSKLKPALAIKLVPMDLVLQQQIIPAVLMLVKDVVETQFTGMILVETNKV